MQPKTVYATSLREVLVFFYKYRSRLLLSFILPFLLAVGASFIPSPRYVAGSVLIVRFGSEYVYQSILGNSQTPEIPFQQDQIFKSEVAILGSKDLHREVIESIGVDKLYPVRPLRKAINAVTGIFDTVAISTGLKDEPTDEDRQNSRMAAAVDQFNKRLEISLERESAVINVNFQHKDPLMAAEALDTLLKQYMEKRKQLYSEPRLKMAEDQAEALKKKAHDAEMAMDIFKRTYELHDVELQRINLLASRNDVEKQRILLDSPSLKKKLDFYNQQLDDLDRKEHKFTTLERDAKLANDEYALAVRKVNEAQALDLLSRERIGSVRIIQNATVSPYPIGLQPLIIGAGFFISVLLFFCVAAVTEFSRNGFLTPEELERALNLPVLAVLPLRKEMK